MNYPETPIHSVGIIGGGQLARMTHQAAISMGLHVAVLDPGMHPYTNEPYCAAGDAGAESIHGALDDPEALYTLAGMSQVTTFEIEHIAADPLIDLAGRGYRIRPDPSTLALIQDKYAQKEDLRARGIPVADSRPVTSTGDFTVAREQLGSMIVKSRKGGYDGRGNLVVKGQTWQEVADHFGQKAPALYAEKLIPFRRELSAIVARDLAGRLATYPLVETIHENNICHMTLAPAQVEASTRRDAEEIAYETVAGYRGAGIFAVEMFEDERGQVLVNEVAPRAHNSGHWTIEGSETSQFANHLRAITGRPLGRTAMRAPAAVMINILGTKVGGFYPTGISDVEALPFTANVHWYGKEIKPERKVGHITVLSDSVKDAADKATRARALLEV